MRNKIIGIVAGSIVTAALLIGMILWFFFVEAVKPDVGQEAVLIHKPFFYGAEGVDPTPIKTGRKYVWSTTSHIIVDMQPQQQEIHFDDLMSSDGVPLDFNSIIRYQITDSVDLVGRFGVKWYQNNIEKEFMSRVRQSVRKHGMNETAINTSAIDDIDKEVTEGMKEYIANISIPVKLIDITVGKANPPDSVKNQRIETAAQQQRIQTEGQKKLAEDARKTAEQARAEADNAYREKMQLSPDQFLKLEAIKMQEKACEKGGCTFLIGSDATPTYNLRK